MIATDIAELPGAAHDREPVVFLNLEVLVVTQPKTAAPRRRF
jgi:hypothetical protein